MVIRWLPAIALASLLMAQGTLSNRRAPGFSLPDVEMRQHDLADYRGRIVLLDIMRTQCPHCQTLSRTLERVKQRYGDKVAVLSIVNPPDNVNMVRAYIRENKITTPILFDCGQVAASYMKVTPQNPTVNVPHLFVIDADGWIRHDYAYTPQNKAIFEGRGLFAILDQLLAETPAPAGKK
ncbi:MAG: TlpA disulfide reductase family protein [Bryobacterales bacterium]|nr:TlpA family protein disulfide reductase [Bryobacteraceae bacterium]MDW8131926.1 TlpA disulfide reductase family protein [Bryobacterales bacterium]